MSDLHRSDLSGMSESELIQMSNDLEAACEATEKQIQEMDQLTEERLRRTSSLEQRLAALELLCAASSEQIEERQRILRELGKSMTAAEKARAKYNRSKEGLEKALEDAKLRIFERYHELQSSSCQSMLDLTDPENPKRKQMQEELQKVLDKLIMEKDQMKQQLMQKQETIQKRKERMDKCRADTQSLEEFRKKQKELNEANLKRVDNLTDLKTKLNALKSEAARLNHEASLPVSSLDLEKWNPSDPLLPEIRKYQMKLDDVNKRLELRDQAEQAAVAQRANLRSQNWIQPQVPSAASSQPIGSFNSYVDGCRTDALPNPIPPSGIPPSFHAPPQLTGMSYQQQGQQQTRFHPGGAHQNMNDARAPVQPQRYQSSEHPPAQPMEFAARMAATPFQSSNNHQYPNQHVMPVRAPVAPSLQHQQFHGGWMGGFQPPRVNLPPAQHTHMYQNQDEVPVYYTQTQQPAFY